MRDEGDLLELPIIEAYHPITRRKTLHAVHLPGRPEAYVSKWLTDCIWWLDREGWSRYRLHTARGWYLCHITAEH